MSDKTGLIKKIPDKHYENYMRIVKDAETAYLNRDFIGAMHFMDKAAEVAFAVRGRDKLLFQSYYCLAKFTFEFINELKDFDADPGHIVYYAKKMVEYKYKEFFYMDAVRKRGHIQIHGIPLEDLIEKYNSSFPVFIYVLGKAYNTKVQHKMELAKTTSDFEMRQKLYASVLCEDAYPAFLLYSKHSFSPSIFCLSPSLAAALPTAGSSTKTTSVTSFWAWSEMPTVPSGEIHS